MAEAMSDERLAAVGKALTVADGRTIARELYDEVQRLRALEQSYIVALDQANIGDMQRLREDNAQLRERARAAGRYIDQLCVELEQQLRAVEAQLAETSADGAQWQHRAETAERALAEMRAESGDKPEARCQAMSNTRLKLQCSRPEGHDAAHVADLDGMGRFSWYGDAPQQPDPATVAESMSDERLAEIEARANRGCRCDDHDCVTEFVQLVDEDVPALLAEVKRTRAELEQLRAEVRPEWRIKFDVWHGTDGPTFSREPSARNWLHSYRDNNPGKNDARLQQRYRSDWADVEQQPENSKTTCAFPDCGHPDHQREQQPEGGDRG